MLRTALLAAVFAFPTLFHAAWLNAAASPAVVFLRAKLSSVISGEYLGRQ